MTSVITTNLHHLTCVMIASHLLSIYMTSVKPSSTLLIIPPSSRPGLEVIKLESSLRLKIKLNDWLLADMCRQAANKCALF